MAGHEVGDHGVDAIRQAFLSRFKRHFEQEEPSPVFSESQSVSDILETALQTVDAEEAIPASVPLPVPLKNAVREENPVFVQAAEVLKPGQLCKVIVRKASGMQWELCQRKYDALQAPLRYQEPVRFCLSPETWLQQSFRTQEMPLDLTLERLIVHTASQDPTYHWLEAWTTHENHCLRFYPLPALPVGTLVLLSIPARRWLVTLDQPLQLGNRLFDHEALPDSLKAPVVRIDPMLDIERRVRSGAPLRTPQDSFRVFFKAREGLLKARLDTHTPLVIPHGDWVEAYALQERFLKHFAAYWMTHWEYQATMHWYFSCRFENPVAGRMKVQVFAVQLLHGKQCYVPWVFTRQESNRWTAHALKGEQPDTACWEPEALFQHILLQQPLALGARGASDYFYAQTALPQTPVLPRYQDVAWQKFEADSCLLSEIFALLARQMSQGEVDTEMEETLEQLLRHERLSRPTQRLLTQRFEAYRTYIQQPHQHADVFHYIQTFWETLFQAFFEQLEVPASLLHWQRVGTPYTVQHGEKTHTLHYFESRSSHHEELLWSLRWDAETQSGTLLDINQKYADGLPRRHSAFTFMHDYQALPLNIKAFVEPYWRYFSPVARQFNKGM